MMKWSYTPGPWETTGALYRGAICIDDSNGKGIAITVSGARGARESTANAYLIAAAPDLINAVRKALSILVAYGDPEEVEVQETCKALSLAIETAEINQ